MTHTQEPWRMRREVVQDGKGGHTTLTLYADNGTRVKEIAAKRVCGPSSEEDEANFHLLVNAPKILATLKMAVEALYNVPFVGDTHDQQHSDTHLRACHDISTFLHEIEELEAHGAGARKSPR